MARLHTTILNSVRGTSTLEIKPNSPSQREMVDTYTLRLWVHDQLVYDRIHSVRDWQKRHFYVEEIARAFCCIHDLIGETISCAPNVVSNGTDETEFLSPVCAHIETDWLQIVLSATNTKRRGDIVSINLYLQQERNLVGDPKKLSLESLGNWGEWGEMLWTTILCKPEEAIAFGKQLLEEIYTVEQERVSLGIPKYDDPSYPE